MNFYFFSLLISLLAPYHVNAMFLSFDPHEHHDVPVNPNKDSIKTEQEIKKLKEELYELEGSLFYKKYLSPINTVREGTASMVGVAGIIGSFIAPYKIVKNSPAHPYRVFVKRAKITVASLCTATAAACTISYARPLLWYKEHKRDTLKKKIFELQSAIPHSQLANIEKK